MFAVPFDLERRDVRGTAVAVLYDVAYDPVAHGAQYDVSRTGTLVYRRHVGSSATVQWLDPTGKQEPLLAKPGAYVGTPRVSPDGKRIAITIEDGSNQDIWVYEPKRDAMTKPDLRWGKVFQLRSGLTTDGMSSTVCWAAASDGVVRTALASRRCCSRAISLQFPTAFSHGRQARVLPAGRRQSANLDCSD